MREHSVVDQHWRYIRYADGSEELYELRSDPRELANLLHGTHVSDANRSEADRLAKWLPKVEMPLAEGSANRILEKREDGFYWRETEPQWRLNKNSVWLRRFGKFQRRTSRKLKKIE